MQNKVDNPGSADRLRPIREFREDTARELNPVDPEVILKGNKP